MPQIQGYQSNIVGDGRITAQIKSTAAEYQGLASLGQDVVKADDNVSNSLVSAQAKKDATTGFASMSSQQVLGLKDVNSTTESFNPDTTSVDDIPTLKNFKDATDSLIQSQSDPSVIEALTKHQGTLYDNLAKTVYARNKTLQTQEMNTGLHQIQTNNNAAAYGDPNIAEPGVLDGYLKQAQDSVDLQASMHNLPDDLHQKYSADTSSAIRYMAIAGVAKDDPDKAAKLLASMDPEDLGGKYKAASDLVDRAQTTAQKQADAQAKKADTVQAHTQLQQYHMDYGQLDAGSLGYQDIQNNLSLNKYTPQQADLLTRRLDSLVKGAYQGSDAMARDADIRLRLPPNDPNAITDFHTLTAEYNGGANMGLDQKHLKRFAATYLAPPDADPGVKTQMGALSDAAAKTLILPSAVPWGDKEGMSRWGSAVTFMHNDYQTKMASGKFTSDQLLNPSSKDYIGASINQFQRTPQEIAQHASTAVHNPAQSLNADKTYAPPYGANGKFTPMPTGSAPNAANPAGGGFSAAELEQLKSMGPTIKKKAGS